MNLLLALLLAQTYGSGYCPTGYVVQSIPRNGPIICIAAGGGGAPTSAQYWVGAADAGLSAEKNLGALSTGLVLNTAGTPSAYAGATCTTPNLLQSLNGSGAGTCYQLKLSDLANPNGDTSFNMVDNHLKFTWVAPLTNPSFDAAVEFETTGAFTGHFFEVHQFTGNPGPGTHLVHIEGTDQDVLPLHVKHSNLTYRAAWIEGGLEVDGILSADGGVVGNVTGSVAGNASTATALAADPANCSAGQAPLGITASGAVEGCFTPAGTYVLPDAAAGTTGGVRLTGDLGGTATSPAVVDDSHNHTGTTISALDTGDVTTGVLAGARGGVGVALPTCSGTDKLTANGTQVSCAADQTGGAGSAVSLSVSVSITSVGVFSQVVTGQAWVTASSNIVCAPQATDADGQTIETYFVANLKPVVSSVVAGTGFTLNVTSLEGAYGTFRFACTGV